jgi:mono/diheme cytochrome c family protein
MYPAIPNAPSWETAGIDSGIYAVLTTQQLFVAAKRAVIVSMRPTYWPHALLFLALGSFASAQAPPSTPEGTAPQASYVDAGHSMLRLEVDGKTYLVDVAAGTVHPAGNANGSPAQQQVQPGGDLFAQRCAGCHGTDGRGITSAGTPNFTRSDLQAGLTDQQIGDIIRNGKSGRMPAFGGEFSDQQISALTSHIRSFAQSSSSSSNVASASTPTANSGIYQAGDDVLFTLPSGRPVDSHSFTVNFTHRFPYGPAFTSSPGAGVAPQLSQAFGLDNFALPSIGVRYGITDRLSVDLSRSPSFISRPVQFMVAYKVLDEHHEDPFNLTFRVSVEGQNNFRKNYTENIEAIISRSITSHAQFYFVPTASFNDRRLVQGSLESDQIEDLPGVNAFSLGEGIAIDIRPTIALIAEVIPTVVGGTDLGIHRPPFSFAIQKKLYRHAFTLGVTTSPGTTVSQRAGTNATFLNNPRADTFSGLFLGFDITRRIY